MAEPARELGQLVSHIRLPTELQLSLHKAYLLHVLALRPFSVLPPGKSVLSLYTQTRSRGRNTPVGETNDIEARVRRQLEKAFWDEALEKLSSSSPAVQMPRLQLLSADLHEALLPLLPKNDLLMVPLIDPMSPTSSPILSTLLHISPILSKLLTLCSPVRDEGIKSLLEPLSAPLSARDPNLPKLCVDTFKGTLELAGRMADDLRDALIMGMDENTIKALIRQEAGSIEREVVTQMYGAEGISQGWGEWLSGGNSAQDTEEGSRAQWLKRLMQTLISDYEVQPLLPPQQAETDATEALAAASTGIRNPLPPPLLLASPYLFALQNTIQALTIAACLALLIQTKPAPGDSSSHTTNFSARVWALLSSEILPGDSLSPQSHPTKLAHLEEETVSTWKSRRLKRKADSMDLIEKNGLHPAESGQSGGSGNPALLQSEDQDADAEAERALRKSVSRILRTEDPVFTLLRKRLAEALQHQLLLPPAEPGPAEVVPDIMRTGRQTGPLHTTSASPPPERRHPKWDGKVKGFEFEALRKEIVRITAELRDVVAWVEEVWPCVLGD